MKKIIFGFSLISLILSGCHAKKIALSDEEIILEKELSTKYHCITTLTIDERSVGLNRFDGTYSVNFDFTKYQNLCEIDSSSLVNIVDRTFKRVVKTMGYKKNHKIIGISFSQTTRIKGIETTTCSRWFKLRISDGKRINYFISK